MGTVVTLNADISKISWNMTFIIVAIVLQLWIYKKYTDFNWEINEILHIAHYVALEVCLSFFG